MNDRLDFVQDIVRKAVDYTAQRKDKFGGYDQDLEINRSDPGFLNTMMHAIPPCK